MALLSKNKLQFVDDTITVPLRTDPLYSAWERCNTMVLSWLHHSISPSIMNSVLWLNFGYDVWRDLRERFSQGDVFRISDLQEEINAFKQDDRSVTDYFTELKILWDELMNFRPIPVCSCPTSCSCGVFATLQKYHDNDYVIRFLKGLHDRFAAVRSQIMLIDPLPTINKAFSLVIQQERHLPAAGSSQLFVSNTLRQHPSSRKSQPKSVSDSRQCTFCGKSRHTVDTCYEKHGYPPGYKSRGRTSRAHTVLTGGAAPSLDASQSVAILPPDPPVTLTQDQLHFLYPQALPSLKMIGTAKVLHGLYILDSPAQTLSITTPIALSATNTSCSLWHPRLSHLSDSRLKLLSPYIPSLSISTNAPCKACHLAK
ncbi:uncharacterized protein [Gossypium hirsutum]|uniref:Retrotransposon gag domain-containing protein n=1 Tax=Gossypium hirsutum TaxID=3635 RepID=A0A1U8KZJ9_GOSHI|nr:uncharacterized protein LOC107922332 [Gossypium hirsutum]